MYQKKTSHSPAGTLQGSYPISDFTNAESTGREIGKAITIISVLVLVGFLVISLLFSFILSLEKLSDLSQAHIDVWQDINRQIIYIAKKKQLSELHATALHLRIQDSFDREQILRERVNARLKEVHILQKIFLTRDEQEVLSKSKDLERGVFKLAKTFRDAPPSLIQTGLSYWDTTSIVAIKSGKSLSPLKNRAEMIDTLEIRCLQGTWVLLASVIVADLIAIVLIWRWRLEPAFDELSRSLHRERSQWQKVVDAQQMVADHEREMRIILDNLPGLVASIDREFKYLSVNRSYRKWYGLADDVDLTGIPVREVIGEKLWLQIRPRMEAVFEGEPVTFDIELDLKEGKRFMRATYVPDMNTEGKVVRLFSLIIDIHERRLLEETLRQREEHTRITLDSIGEAVVATNKTGSISSMNPIAERLTGWTLKSALGKPVDEVVSVMLIQNHKYHANALPESLNTALIKKISGDAELLSKAGMKYQIAITASPITNNQRDTVGAVIVFRDITRDLTLRNQLIETEKMRTIGQLAGGVSHDFNNLLAGISGAAEFLELTNRDKLDEQSIGLLETILSATRRGADLSKKLVEFVQEPKQAGAIFDLADTLSDTIDIFSRTTDRTIHLEVIDKAENTRVFGNEAGLHSSILNMLINSAHAMPQGGAVSIQLTNRELSESDCDREDFDMLPGEHIQLTITDTGLGISEDQMGNIFEPFFSTKDTSKGSGLGLYTVYSNIKKHKGSITVSSKAGQGTSFTILLPVTSSLVDEEMETKPSKIDTDEKSVLVVDDEEMVRNVITMFLENLGYNVFTAVDGEEGLLCFNKYIDNISLVIMDFNMPKEDGCQATMNIKKLNPDCPVILVTGYTEPDTLKSAQLHGVDAVIQKPVRCATLLETISKVLDSKREATEHPN